MGWYFTNWATRKDIIEELTSDTDETGRESGRRFRRVCLAKCYKGAAYAGVLYAVIRQDIMEADATEWTEGEPFILVAMLRHSKHDGIPAWGYKEMCESMHPYYYGCPLSYLDMAPVANQEWRDQTREAWAERKAKAAKRREARKAAEADLAGMRPR
jgi:hypothetical protein